MAESKVKQDLLITSQQTLDLVNTELNRLKVEILRIEKNNTLKDDVITKLKDKVSVLDSDLNSSKKNLEIMNEDVNKYKGEVNRLEIQNNEKHELIITLKDKIYTIIGDLENSKENNAEVEHMYKISKNTICRLDSDIIRLEREIYKREKNLHCEKCAKPPKNSPKGFQSKPIVF